MTPPHFYLSTNIGGQVNCNKSKDNQYLTEEQARHVEKKGRIR